MTAEELPKLCEMRIAGLVQCQGIKAIVVNPAQGLIVPLSDPDPCVKSISPSSPVTHWGQAEYGTYITWKPFGEPQGNPPLTPEFEAFVRSTPIPSFTPKQ